MTDLEADLAIAQARIKELEKKMAGMVEVVRCKDCKRHSQNTPDGLHWCDEHERGCLMDEDFCSYGERRENDRS